MSQTGLLPMVMYTYFQEQLQASTDYASLCHGDLTKTLGNVFSIIFIRTIFRFHYVQNLSSRLLQMLLYTDFLEYTVDLDTYTEESINTHTARPVCWREWIS